MIELFGKKVVVEAFGIQYRGVLMEVNETEVHLQTEMGWVSIPLEGVSSIRADNDN